MHVTRGLLSALAIFAMPGLTATFANAQSYSQVEGWDYNIVDTKSYSWMPVNYAAENGAKILDAKHHETVYSDVEGADGSRLADFDLDGDLDILTVYEEAHWLYVYENTSPIGTHRNAWRRHLVGQGCGASEEAIFYDFDGDNYPDIICVATAGSGSTSRTAAVQGERVYGYRNLVSAFRPCTTNGGFVPSTCWALNPTELGGGTIPQRDWYRLGGDMGSADVDKDGCPDLLLGSAGGDVGVLWCPGVESAMRQNLANWTFQRIMWTKNDGTLVQDGEVQRMKLLNWNGKNWIVWSVKEPRKGVYVVPYTTDRAFGPITQIVDDTNSMEFEIANIDGVGGPDLILPTREDPLYQGNKGMVRVYWGAKNQQEIPWLGANMMQLKAPWDSGTCNSLRNYNILKGVDVGNIITGANGVPAPDIVTMGRGCPFAANGVFYYDGKFRKGSAKRKVANWKWFSLTNHLGQIMQDSEEQKWDSPQIGDIDGDGDLDIVGSDENGDWGDTWSFGSTGDDPDDAGVGTVVFWNQ